MRNDTHDLGPEDSQDPLMSERNEIGDPSVADYMMEPEDIRTPHPDDHAPAVPGAPVDTVDTPTTSTEPISDAVTPSAVESTPFDYETYYASEPLWPSDPDPEPLEEAEPKRSGVRDTSLFLVGALAAGVLGAALTIGALAATGTLSEEEAAPTTTVTTVAAPAVVADDEPAAITNTIINNELGSAVNPTAVAAKAVPSIVTVGTFSSAPDPENIDDSVGVGSGSGVVLTGDGYIATNEHVVDGASFYTVTFEDGRVYEAELIGQDALTDLAVLKITGDGLVPIDLGTTDDLALGDPAIAIGNPLGQDGGSSISVGIVSAFDRRVDFGDGSRLFGMLQTDAAINSGSSGGALVDADGNLIGITAAIGVSNAGPEGIGYAIPVELVQRITDEIIETGDVDHPFLGVQITTHTEEQPDGAIKPSGARIATIEGTDSAAAAAGLQAGDVIIRIGDKDIQSQNDLILAVRLYRVGDEVEFVAVRDGDIQSFNVVMGQRPESLGG